MRLTPKIALVAGISVFCVSIGINLFLVETVVRQEGPARIAACEKFRSSAIRSYCSGRVKKTDVRESEKRFFDRLSESGGLVSGMFSSLRTASGNGVLALIDPVSKTYRVVDSRSKSILQSACESGEEWNVVGISSETGKSAAAAYFYDPDLRFREARFFKEARNIRDCVATKEGFIGSTHSVGGLILNEKGQEVARSRFWGDKTAVTSNHEILRFDLDSDGKEEIYLTPTVDNEILLRNLSGAEGEANTGSLVGKTVGAIERLDEENGKYSVRTIDSFTGGYVKEVAPVSHNGKNFLFAPKSDVAKPSAELLSYAFSNGKAVSKPLATIPKRECRNVLVGKFGFPDTNVAVGCEKGLYVYSFDGSALTLRKEYDLSPPMSGNPDPNDHQVHALEALDTNGDGTDELVVGIDMDGVYVYDFAKGSVDKLVNLGADEYVWFLKKYGGK